MRSDIHAQAVFQSAFRQRRPCLPRLPNSWSGFTASFSFASQGCSSRNFFGSVSGVTRASFWDLPLKEGRHRASPSKSIFLPPYSLIPRCAIVFYPFTPRVSRVVPPLCPENLRWFHNFLEPGL